MEEIFLINSKDGIEYAIGRAFSKTHEYLVKRELLYFFKIFFCFSWWYFTITTIFMWLFKKSCEEDETVLYYPHFSDKLRLRDGKQPVPSYLSKSGRTEAENPSLSHWWPTFILQYPRDISCLQPVMNHWYNSWRMRSKGSLQEWQKSWGRKFLCPVS